MALFSNGSTTGRSLLALFSLSLFTASPSWTQGSDAAKVERSTPVPKDARPATWDEANARAIAEGHPLKENPWQRANLRWLQLKDKNGEYDPSNLLKAKAHVKAMAVSPTAWPSSRNPAAAPAAGIQPLAAGIQPSQWTAMGPGNIGGRIRSILVHPANPDLIYLGSVSGGIWRSTNAGASWAPLNDFMPNINIGSMVMDPRNPDIIYAGTGESYSGDALRGAGVFRTTDGGVTWNRLNSTASGSAWHHVNRMAISPVNSSLVLAATGEGLYRSLDAGATWTNRLDSTPAVQDLDFHPTDGARAVASGKSRAWYTTDFGATWTEANGLPTRGRREVAYARSNPNIVYASVDVNGGEVYRSMDGGQNYFLVSSGSNLLEGQGWYDNALWVDPNNPNTLMVGGIWLYRSTNGGVSWEFISYNLHADVHVILSAPTSAFPRRVLVGCDGGFYRADDFLAVGPQAPWTNLNNTLGITQFYAGAGNPNNGFLMGGTQDNGTPGFSGNVNAWVDQAGGDGGWTASDPVLDPDGSSVWYGEHQNWSTYRVKLDRNGGLLNFDYLSGAPETGSLFIPPMMLDPNGHSRLYKGGYSLWRLDNPRHASRETPWLPVKTPMDSLYISAIATAPGNPDVVWVGYADRHFPDRTQPEQRYVPGEVYSSSNALAGSPTWTRRTPVRNRYFTRVTIDPGNSSRVYATTGGFNADNVWKTEDGGANWTNISSNLPAVPVRTLVVNPRNTNHIYVGTEVGVFASENRGGSWSPSNDGPANVSVDELFWVGNKLTAATHGRGMFQITVNTPPTASITSPSNNSTFLAGANIPIQAGATDPDGSIARVEFFQGGTKLGEDLTSPYAFTWNAVPAGTYVLTARATDNNGGIFTSAAVNITVGAGNTTTRAPLADAHVRDGSSAATNFGSAAKMEAKTTTQLSYNRDAYLRFDISGLSGSPTSVRLRVYANLSQATTATLGAYAVSDNSWTETGITWNNRPALGSSLATAVLSGTTYAWYEFDVTAHVRAARNAGQTSISLALHTPANINPNVNLNSREAAANRPELVFGMTQPQALLVVGNTALNAGDAAIRNRLTAMGFAVTVKAATASTTADANGMTLVFVSSTVGSGDVNTKFRTVAVPVVTSEPSIQDDMGMTGLTNGTDYGTVSNQTQLRILNSGHPLAASLTGTQTIATVASAIGFGKPASTAVSIAGMVGDNSRIGHYAYERNAAMVGLTAPARRVFISLADGTAASYTSAGWALFDAAINWTAGF